MRVGLALRRCALCGDINAHAHTSTHTQVVPDYIDVEATGFASNFLPGNNQGFLQQKITMTNNAMAQVEWRLM
jgi:hypothetical protein